MDRTTTSPDALRPQPPSRRAVFAARTFVVRLAARIPGLDPHAARRNAWEAVCATRERRRQWDAANEHA
ncbi:MAG TPA: hypothetical protein VIL34_15455 [Actinopolymorphaceae bacterium]